MGYARTHACAVPCARAHAPRTRTRTRAAGCFAGCGMLRPLCWSSRKRSWRTALALKVATYDPAGYRVLAWLSTNPLCVILLCKEAISKLMVWGPFKRKREFLMLARICLPVFCLIFFGRLSGKNTSTIEDPKTVRKKNT